MKTLRSVVFGVVVAVSGCVGSVGPAEQDGGVTDAGGAQGGGAGGGGAGGGAGGGSASFSVAITTPSAKTYVNGTVFVALSVTGSPARVSVLVDGSEVAVVSAPYTVSVNTTSMTEATHVLTARAQLASETVDSAPLDVVVDRTAPVVVSRWPDVSSTNGATAFAPQPFGARFSEPLLSSTVSATSYSVLLSTLVAPAGVTTPALSADGLTLSARVTSALVAFPTTVTVTPSASLTDLAGNPVVASAAAWSYVIDRWSVSTSLMSGGATRASWPSLAVDAQSVAWVAFAEQKYSGATLDPTFNVIQVRQFRADDAPLVGGGLPFTGDASGTAGRPALVIDASGRPVVAYSEFDSAISKHRVLVKRLEGGAWVSLGATVGVGVWPVMVLDSAGAPVIAYVDDSTMTRAVHVSRFDGTTWSMAAPDLPGTFAAQRISMVLGVADAPVVAWVDNQSGAGQVRVAKAGSTSWSPLGPSLNVKPVGLAGWVQLAQSSAQVLSVAWEEDDGFGPDVHVASWSGSAWSLLGRPVDTELRSAATAPTLQVDSTGAPMVAWVEEGDWGVLKVQLARFDGADWRSLGGEHVAVARAGLSLPQLVLDHDLPMVALVDASSGETTAQVLLRRFNGIGVGAATGLSARPAPSACAPLLGDVAFDLLSQTQCFAPFDGGAPVPASDLIAYDLNSPLWSDSALKRRWFRLPDDDAGTFIQYADAGAWDFPLGTVIVKEFSYEQDPADRASRRPVETRFLVRRPDAGWEGFNYQWNDTFTEAVLLTTGTTKLFARVASALDGGHTQIYPSQAQCRTCHATAAGFLLGLQAGQLNRAFDYAGVRDEQLVALERVGLFGASSPGFVSAASAPRFTPPTDATAPLEQRVRGYLAANCAHCHRPGGARPTRDFRWEPALLDTHICDVGAPSGPEVNPGDAGTSLMHVRLSTRGPGQMPPLATNFVDPTAIQVVDEWINSISSCP